jgi:hypothetical protein
MIKFDEPVAVNADIRLTIERLEALKKVCGLSFSQLLEADDEVRLRGLAFLQLYRRDMLPGARELGVQPDPDDLWERAARVEITFGGPVVERLDPTSEGLSKTLLSSADIGV